MNVAQLRVFQEDPRLFKQLKEGAVQQFMDSLHAACEPQHLMRIFRAANSEWSVVAGRKVAIMWCMAASWLTLRVSVVNVHC
eukprot:1709262-Rhodomonas_salina.1